MKLGLSLFWRVLVVQLIFSVIGALLLAPSSINTDMGLIRYKPSIAQMSFAIVLWLSMFFSKNGLIHFAWGKRLNLGSSSWRRFTKMLAVVMVLLALTNMAVIQFLTMEQWMTFKSTIPLTVELVFCLSIRRLLPTNLAD